MTIVNRRREPGYAGLPTFCKSELALTAAELAGVDVAILGAPFDEGVSNRPGARFGPRAIRASDNYSAAPPSRPHPQLGVDPFKTLRVVDYGDAECVPGSLRRSHNAVRKHLNAILAAGAVPVVLGGDHSLAYVDITATAVHFAPQPIGVIQFDAHADTGANVLDVAPHGTAMRRVIEEGTVCGANFIQFGLRGCWPGPDEFAWMKSVGMRWHPIDEIDEHGFDTALDTLLTEARGLPPHILLSIDIDVLDPAYAPGTGTPEPGGLSPRELFRAIRLVCKELDIVTIELVEVSPPYDHSGITALAAQRCIIEALAGIALRRRGRNQTGSAGSARSNAHHGPEDRSR